MFAWLGALYALYPLLEIGGYGLLLHKRSRTVLYMTLAATALNTLLSLWLIPRYEYMGATWAAVGSFAALGIGLYALCPRDLRYRPDLRAWSVAGGAGLAFVLAVEGSGLFGLVSPWTRLFAAGGLWAVLYVVPVLALDARLRDLVRHWRTRSAA